MVIWTMTTSYQLGHFIVVKTMAEALDSRQIIYGEQENEAREWQATERQNRVPGLFTNSSDYDSYNIRWSLP